MTVLWISSGLLSDIEDFSSHEHSYHWCGSTATTVAGLKDITFENKQKDKHVAMWE